MAICARPTSIGVEISEHPISISASVNWELAATLFENTNSLKDAPVVLLSSAAGVPRGYYSNFARCLISEGAKAVLTYDYRGMSDSAGDRTRWPELRMFDWARYDFADSAKWLKEQYPDRPLLGMGHSFGGQALGLSGASHLFERYVTVATMSGYWRGLDTPYRVWFQTQLIGKPISKLLGYVPKLLAPGEGFPGKIMLDWANWIAKPNYWFDENDVPGLENFAHVTLPFLSIGIKDDPWGTAGAVASFMQHYSNAEFHQHWIEIGESGPIGHLGFFRQKHRDHHWSAAVGFLLHQQLPGNQGVD